MKLHELTIKETAQGLKNGEFSALDVCRDYLGQIKESNKDIFAYLSVDEKGALKQAEEADGLISEGKAEILTGIPSAIKDNIMVCGLRCTSASKILENYVAPYDATVIKKLKEKKAVFLGKTNMDEFAMGSSTENSAFGITENPRDLSRVPGGSSGGSAAAVASNMAAFALGSDTGGSIRLPAAFCGVVGLKPTYGAVSRYGLTAFASSLDQIGPLAKTVEDAKIVFEAISGKDPMDSTSVDLPAGGKEFDLKKMRVGIPKEYFIKGIDAKIEEEIRSAIKKYEDMGVKVEEISLPHTDYALAAYYIINPSEASANLARFDGIRYGYSAGGKDLLDLYMETKGKGFGPEVRRRIMLGTYALSSGYYDAYYLRAQKVRTLIKKDFEKAFEKVDAIFTPTSPIFPFKIGEKASDPLSMYLVDIYTVSVNLVGVPALTFPIAKVGNLPVGLQIIGKPFRESTLFNLGNAFPGN
jgi:aspartyl-tRNA(Asn)/glutamyl-tRNA(Gln) amidotransferase subunit A